MKRIPLNSADEQCALTKARGKYSWSRTAIKAIKTAYRKRFRQKEKDTYDDTEI